MTLKRREPLVLQWVVAAEEAAVCCVENSRSAMEVG